MKLKFNEQKFIEQSKAIYGANAIDECQRLNSKTLIQETFVYNCPKVEVALNTICNNEVGNLMIKLFHLNKNRTKKLLQIINADWEVEGYENYVFHANKFAVYAKPSRNSQLNLLRLGQNKLICKSERDTTDTSLFHEINHAFHYLMNRRQKNTQILDEIYDTSCLKGIWGKYGKELQDEEFYNITGWYCDKYTSEVLFDSINSNMYEVCKYCKNATTRSQLYQRISHKNAEALDKFANEHHLGIEDFLKNTDKFLINTNEWVLSDDNET